MAEDTVDMTASRSLNGGALSRMLAFVDQHRVIPITVAFVIVAFVVYYYAGEGEAGNPGISPYNNFVILGDAILEGHVDIHDGAALRSYMEMDIREGKHYIIPPAWPAILMLPGVAIWERDFDQTLFSAVIGAITAGVVFLIARRLSDRLETQLWLTVLPIFGTVFWYAAANGGVWFFSHTVAVLFLFLAIFFTLVRRQPLLAGLCLGAAYWTRQSTILTLPFFLIMFSDLWLKPVVEGEKPWHRLRLEPLLQLGAGLSVFLAASFVYNYLRFETPLDASQHYLPDNVKQEPWFNHGPFDVRYVSRHVFTAFERMPLVSSAAPYVVISTAGMALWLTTPAYFIGLFNRVRNPLVVAAGILLLIVAVGIPIGRAVSGLWDSGFYTYTFPEVDFAWFYKEGIPVHVNTLPFFIVIAGALWFSRKDKFAMACWAAVIPAALMLFTFAGTGFAQFGYRFSLDYMPFLFLLTANAIGNDIKWYHKVLIVLSILVNLCGVLWAYHFDPQGFLDYRWVTV
jgi:hypothetical protein